MRATEFLTESYKEIEFVCANPDFPEATDPEKQQQMFLALKKIPGVIPLFQDQSAYSEGQKSLTAIYKDAKVKSQILKLAKQLGVQVDLIQPVSDDYVDRALRGEHEGQLNELFQQGKNWKWEFRGSEEAMATFTVGDIEYFWHAAVENIRRPNIWTIAFRVRWGDPTDQEKMFGLTGTGNSSEVISTVVDITRTFLQEYGDKVLELRFSSKGDSRTSLYVKMVKRLLPKWNLHTKRVDGETDFYLTNPRAYEK